MSSGAWEEITALAELLAAPVGTSINGQGAIDEGHALSLGVVGGNGARATANWALEQADLVFFIGTKTSSVTTLNWTLPEPGKVTVIHLDIDPMEIGNTYPTRVGLAGDAQATLRELLLALRQRPGLPRSPDTSWHRELAQRSQVDWQAVAGAMGSDAMPMKPERLVKELAEALPTDTIVVADPGTPTPFVSAYLRARAGRHIVIPRGHGGLGYALPGVIGAKLAAPQRTVVGLCGDGSFGTACGDLETISRLNLPITLIQCTNSSYGWIKMLQHLYHQEKYLSVDFSPDTNYAAIAEAFGLQAVRIERPGELGAVLRQALSSDQPTFLDVITESEVTHVPPVAAWQQALAERRQRCRVGAGRSSALKEET